MTEIRTPRGDGDTKKGVTKLSKHNQAPEKHEPEIRGAKVRDDLRKQREVRVLGRSEDKP